MRVRQNNEWLNISEEIQWKQNNEWRRHSSAAYYPDYYVFEPYDWFLIEEGIVEYWGDGMDPYIVIPEKDTTGVYQVDMVVLAQGIPIQGIATGAAKLTSTSFMFAYQGGVAEPNTIELDYFFTPEVRSMEAMFDGCMYEYLDLRSFDTKKCIDFSYMFFDAPHLTTVDMSSFDIVTTDNVSGMFEYSSVELVYVKNSQIAEYLEIEGGKSGIHFQVGSST